MLYYPITGSNRCYGQWAISHMLLLEVSENAYDPPLFFKQLLSCFIFSFLCSSGSSFQFFHVCLYVATILSDLKLLQVVSGHLSILFRWTCMCGEVLSTYEDISSYSFRTEVQNKIFATTMANFQASRG